MEILETWEPALGTVPLLAIAAGAIGLILIMVIGFKIHAFVTLVIVSALTAIASGIPLSGVVPTLTGGFGTTLGSVALLAGLGTMIGCLVETSGGQNPWPALWSDSSAKIKPLLPWARPRS